MLPGLACRLDALTVTQELLPALSSLLHQHLSWLEKALVPQLGLLMEVLPRQGQTVLLEVG
jgi:hypothetical protein